MDAATAFLLLGLTPAAALAGWYLRGWKTKRDNRKYAKAMMASIQASKSRRKPEDTISYDNRQRTAAPNNGVKARQGNVVFRPRKVRRKF